MNARKLLEYLTELDEQGVNLGEVDVLYRFDADSDETEVQHVCEDLYDPKDNITPISIMLSTKRLDEC